MREDHVHPPQELTREDWAYGERVIVDGFQKMMPGAPVNPVPWVAPGKGPAASPASPAGSAPAAGAAAASAAPASAASR